MTKTEALARLEGLIADREARAVLDREKAAPLYWGEVHRMVADAYRIATAVASKIDKEEETQ